MTVVTDLFQTLRTRLSTDPRLLRLIHGSGALALARIASLVASFVIVALTLDYLGQETYGLWMAITSVVMIVMTVTNGGIPNGITTAAAAAHGENDTDRLQRILSCAFAIFLPLSITLTALGYLVTRLVDWAALLSIPPSIDISIVSATAFLVVLSCTASFLVNATLKLRNGIDQIPAVSAWEAAAAISALPAIWIVVTLDLGLIGIAFAALFAPVAVRGISSIIFMLNNPSFVPSVNRLGLADAKLLFGNGAAFFFATIGAAIAIQTDQVLIANIVGLSDVTTYAITQKLFTIPWILCNFVFAAQWPAFSRAAAQKDYGWIKQNFYRVLSLSVLLSVSFSLLLWMLHPGILAIWLGDNAISPGLDLLSGMAFFAAIQVVNGALFTLLVSLDIRRPLIITSIASALINLPLTILLLQIEGAAGAIWATNLATLFVTLIPLSIFVRRRLAQFE